MQTLGEIQYFHIDAIFLVEYMSSPIRIVAGVVSSSKILCLNIGFAPAEHFIFTGGQKALWESNHHSKVDLPQAIRLWNNGMCSCRSHMSVISSLFLQFHGEVLHYPWAQSVTVTALMGGIDEASYENAYNRAQQWKSHLYFESRIYILSHNVTGVTSNRVSPCHTGVICTAKVSHGSKPLTLQSNKFNSVSSLWLTRLTQLLWKGWTLWSVSLTTRGQSLFCFRLTGFLLKGHTTQLRPAFF